MGDKSFIGAGLARGRRRTLASIALAAAVGIGVGIWRLDSGTAAAPASSEAVVKAVRDDVVVSVGGVGRIVEAGHIGEIALPAGKSSSAGASSAPADAVFARAVGRIARFFVEPGQRVGAGQTLAVLDDGGVAAAAVRQAQSDLAIAELELRQKQTSDPLKGVPPTRAEIAAAKLAVPSARARLTRLLGPPRPEDVSAARLELKRAEADLETLRGGSRSARTDAIAVAKQAVDVAQGRLDKLLAGPSPADVSVAQAELAKAESDLAVLQRPAAAPLAESIAAAEATVTAMRDALARAQAVKIPVPADVSLAQADLAKAIADLAVLRHTAAGPLGEEIASARQAVETARQKLAKAQAPADPADVLAARLELERARAESRRLQSGPTRAALTAAQQTVTAARAKLARVLGRPLPADVSAAQLDVRRAEAELTVLRSRGGPASAIDIALSRLKVVTARSRVADARRAQDLLTVVAPTSGTVTSLLTAPGAPVDNTTPIAAVADLDRLAATVALSEFDAASVRRGLSANVSVDALGGKTYAGKVLFAALTGTDSNGVVTFPVRVGLQRARGLKPGMNVSVRVIVAQREDVVVLPLEAVERDGDEGTVTVIDASGQTAPRKVALGLANNKLVEIADGLRAGERVVLPGDSGGPGDE